MKEIEQTMMQKWINAKIYEYNIKIEDIDMNRAKQMRLDKFVILFAEELQRINKLEYKDFNND